MFEEWKTTAVPQILSAVFWLYHRLNSCNLKTAPTEWETSQMLMYYSGTSPKIHNCREGHKAVFNIFRCTEAHFSQSTCSLVLNDFNVFTEDRFSNNSQDIEYIPETSMLQL